MKILVLTPLPSPFVQQAFERLKSENERLEIAPVFYGDLSHRPSWGKLDWEGIWLKGSKMCRIKELARYVNEVEPDQVVLGQYNRVESWWLKLYAKKHGIPAHVFFLEPLIPSSPLKKWIKLYLSRKFFSGLASLGCMGRRAFSEYSSIFKGRIFPCPYTFDLTTLKSFNEENRSTERITFLYSGRLSPFRDPLLALKCFKKVNDIAPLKSHLIISGKGELEDEMHAEIMRLGLSEQITWRNEFKDWEDIRNLYRYADVLLSLGVYNTWSLTIQEAMAAGMCVVATHTTEAANELIINSFNGFLVDHDNPASTIRAMLKYVNDPDLVELHGARNREIVEIVDLKAVKLNISSALGL